MSVAAINLDDQRPLMNNYDKISTSASSNYEQNVHVMGGGGGGVVSGGDDGGSGAPPSGPASPTPSGFEELAPTSGATASSSSHHHHSHPHHHNHHHHHHHHHHQAQQEQHQLQQHENQQQQQSSQQAALIAEAVAAAEQRQRALEDEIENLKLGHAQLGLQLLEAQRREKILIRRLANKEQEFQEYVTQIAEFRAQQAPSNIALRTALLDPSVNIVFERFQKEMNSMKKKLEETQTEFSSWKFTADSNAGKRLMAKCRSLYLENVELDKMTSSGRLAKLETELAMQKNFNEKVKRSQSELDGFLTDIDTQVEDLQNQVLFLQQDLDAALDRIKELEKEIYCLKNGISIDHYELIREQDEAGNGATVAINEDLSQQQQQEQLQHQQLQQQQLHQLQQPQEHNQLPNDNMINTINGSRAQLSPNSNEYLKYAHAAHHQLQVQNKLETINENECMQLVIPTSSSVVQHPLVNYYNNSNEQQQPLSLVQEQPTAPPPNPSLSSSTSHMSHMLDDGSNGVGIKRKRYDEDINMSYMTASNLMAAPPQPEPTTIETPAQHVAVPLMPTREISTPRTLPPKKSKLRGITARRNSQLEECGLAGGNSPLLGMSVPPNIISAAPSTSTSSAISASVNTSTSHLGGMIVDNAVVGMASEEYGSAPITNVSLPAPTSMNASPQHDPTILDASVQAGVRILTRRRSVRQLQQNGGSGGTEY